MVDNPKLLVQVGNVIRTKHYSYRTEETYIGWIKRFIYFHDKRHPKDMGVDEVRAILTTLQGDKWLMGHLLYGSGLRLMECLRLRVKDIDFGYKQITVRNGKGSKDRVTMLPEVVVSELKKHLERVKMVHGPGCKGRLRSGLYVQRAGSKI